MNRRWVLALVALGLAALMYVQVRSWRQFDWTTFLAATREVRWLAVAGAVALAFVSYGLRAIRWKVLVRPVRDVPAAQLVAPTIIGFGSLALLGRAGELVRPYLIARKLNVSMASQMGIWTVERIFDLGAYLVLAAVAVFAAHDLPNLHLLRVAAAVLCSSVAIIAVGALAVGLHGAAFSRWVVERSRGHRWARGGAEKLEAFASGLGTIDGMASLAATAALSLAMWACISLMFLLVLHAYPALTWIRYSGAVLLVGFSIVGGAVQLPAVGGGAQIVTILGLAHVFSVRQELAVSCGILLWLVAFQAVLPVALVLARVEHVSMRKLSSAAETNGSAATAADPAANI